MAKENSDVGLTRQGKEKWGKEKEDIRKNKMIAEEDLKQNDRSKTQKRN